MDIEDLSHLESKGSLMTGSEHRARTYVALLVAAALLSALLVPTVPAAAQEEESADVTSPNVDRVRKITVGGVVVYDATLPGGFPDPAATFDVATIDFLARGGDDYNFGGLPFTTLGVTYEQSMLNYLSGPLAGLITDAQYPNAVNTRVIQTG